jgi:O-antigen ligase
MIEDYPLFGIGIGNFNQVYISQNYISPYANEKNLVSPHNIYLHVFTESGLLGGNPFLLLLGYRECKIVCVNRYCMNLLYAPYWGKQR